MLVPVAQVQAAERHRAVGMLDVEALARAVTLASMAMHLRLYSWAAAVPRGLAMVKGVLVVGHLFSQSRRTLTLAAASLPTVQLGVSTRTPIALDLAALGQAEACS